MLDGDTEGVLSFAGCSEEQADLPFDLRALLTAPEAVLVRRAEVEPLLRRAADLVLTSTAPPAELAHAVLAHISDLPRGQETTH